MGLGSFFGGAKKVYGQVKNKDLLEAIAAASLLVAVADGNIDQKEVAQLERSLSGNEKLSAFSSTEISRVVAKYADMLETSKRQGRIAMRKEIEDVGDSPDQAEVVFAVACDVADSGDISDQEKGVLREIAGWLKVNPAEFGL